MNQESVDKRKHPTIVSNLFKTLLKNQIQGLLLVCDSVKKSQEKQ